MRDRSGLETIGLGGKSAATEPMPQLAAGQLGRADTVAHLPDQLGQLGETVMVVVSRNDVHHFH